MLLVVAVAATAGFALARWSTSGATASTGSGDVGEQTEQRHAVPVQTAIVRSGEIEEFARAYGTVQATPNAVRALSVPYEVRVTRVLVVAGQEVNAATKVLELVASPDALLQLRQAENALASAEANLAEVRRRLAEQLATNTELATTQQAEKAARTLLNELRRRGMSEGTATVEAGMAGIVDVVGAQPGQTVLAGTPLLALRPPDAVEARLGVAPEDAVGLKLGTSVVLLASGKSRAHADTERASGDSAAQIQGVVRLVVPQINLQSRLRDVTVSLPANTRLVPGDFVEAEWTARSAKGLVVPRGATQQLDGEWVVYVARDGKAQRHVVVLGLQDGVDVQIVSDEIREGDEVITVRNGQIEDGTPVEPEPVLAPTTSPTPVSAARGK